jgi:glycerol uptake facilitator protein
MHFHSPWFGEFMGTTVLLYMGLGVVANGFLKSSKGQGTIGFLGITIGWLIAVMAGVFTALACGNPAPQLNPSNVVALAIATRNYSHVWTLASAEFAGGFVGATLMWLTYQPHWKATEDGHLKHGCFAASPAIWNPPANFLTEALCTILFVVTNFALISETAAAAPALTPVLAGGLVMGVGLAVGGPTGFSLNAARDLGPRLAYSILPMGTKASANWRYAPIPFFGTLVGGAVAGLMIHAFHFLK